MLLIVFILAYGVAVHALIDPYREWSWDDLGDLLQDIIFLPYWQMFGELNLEGIQVIDSTMMRCNDTRNDSWNELACNPPDLDNIRHSTLVMTSHI